MNQNSAKWIKNISESRPDVVCPTVSKKKFVSYYIKGGAQENILKLCQRGYTGRMIRKQKELEMN